MRASHPTLTLLVALLLLSMPGLAWGDTTCTVSSANLEFGAVDGTSQVDTTADITVDCRTFGVTLLSIIRVRACLHIGAGSTGSGQFAPRQMTNSDGDALAFQIYQDPARSQAWGSSGSPLPNPLKANIEYEVLLLGGSNSTEFTMYGRVEPGQNLAAGSFSNFFADARLDYRYAEPILLIPFWPTDCTTGGRGGGSINFSFTASATVADHCEITATTPLDFGNVPGLINSDLDQASTITMACTGRTAWNIGLDDGLNASGGTRHMRMGGSGNLVRYELYRNDTRNERWGSTVDVDTLPGTGTGHEETVTVHGRVPADQSVPAGQYSDVITVTVTY